MKSINQKSKFLSLILRHQPEIVQLTLSKEGWVQVTDLLVAIHLHSDFIITFDELKDIVATSDKKRFAFSDDFKRIRANQGHSIREVTIPFEDVSKTVPHVLYHGTSIENYNAIINDTPPTIRKMNRNHVHLSPDIPTASIVGQRHGKVIILQIDAQALVNSGQIIYKSENNVFLTEDITADFFEAID